MFSVHIHQASRAISVEIGTTILQAALDEGIDYPHGCQSGNCGACKSWLLAGDVELSAYSEFALTAAEREENLILACRAVPWSDCEISWCDADSAAMHPVRSIRCRVEQIESLTPDIVSIKMSMLFADRLEFSPGQFVAVTFQGMPTREYSIASRAQDNFLEFYVRKIDGGAVSPFIAEHLRPGELATVEGPFGTMYFRNDCEGPVLALAGGSGLSAIQPIVIEALNRDPNRQVCLYHGVRDEVDIYRSELFNDLQMQHDNFDYQPVLSNPGRPVEQHVGMLADVLDSHLGFADNVVAYIAGPLPMVNSCAQVLRRNGVPGDRLFADPFFTQADRA